MSDRIDHAAEFYQRATARALTGDRTQPHPLVKCLTGQRFGKLVVTGWAGTNAKSTREARAERDALRAERDALRAERDALAAQIEGGREDWSREGNSP